MILSGVSKGITLISKQEYFDLETWAELQNPTFTETPNLQAGLGKIHILNLTKSHITHSG